MVAKSTTSSTASRSAKSVTAVGASGGSEVPGPDTVAGLQLWLDSSDPTTILNSVSPDVQATDGQTVRRWLDKSGNDFHANNTVGSEQPVWRTNQLNGKGSLNMDGVNDRLYSTLFTNDSTASVFWVLRSSDSQAMLALSDKTNNNKYSFVSDDGATSAVNSNFGSPQYRVNGANVAWGNRDDVHASVATGSAVVVSAINCSFGVWSTIAGNLVLGYQSTAAASWTGLYAALLIYDSALAANDVFTVENYLATQFGVTLA